MTRIFAIFAGVFVVYIVLDWGMDITGRKAASRGATSQEVGTINGEGVQYKDFSELVRQTTDNQKAQTGTEPDENQLRLIRDQVWNQLVEQHLYDEQIAKLGITVSNQEIIDAVFGSNPPDFLRTQFTDSTGTFNRQAYETALKDPKNKEVVKRVEDIIRKQRLREKLQSIVLSSVRVTEGDIVQRFADDNVRYTADAIFFDPAMLVKDNEIAVGEEDYRRYYNDHQDEFKVAATRKVKYVQFIQTASASDSEGVANDMQDILRRAKSGADFAELAKTYSETPLSDAFFKHGELTPDRETAIFAASAGDIVGPVKEFDGYHLIKVLEFRAGKDEFYHAAHILIQAQNGDSAGALKLARELTDRAKKGENFAALAQQYSKDPSSQRGGDLGWFGKGRMVKPFEEAAMKMKPGQISGPVKTQFGYHVIKLLGRDSREVKVSDIHMKIAMSSATQADISQRAQDFAFLAKEGDFMKEAAQSKYTVLESQPFQKDAVIPGLGINTTVNKFAFNDKVGAVSEAYSLQNGYGVFMVSEAKEAGVRPFDEVKSLIETKVKLDKKIEKLKALAAQLRSTLAQGDSLGKITLQRSDLPVQHVAPFTLSQFLPSIGRDPGFMGAVASMTPGQVSSPVVGQRGVYLIALTSKSALDTVALNAQRDAIRSQLMNDKRNRFFADWSENLKKAAEIVDNRERFFR
jgi:parvulin-like peptidyl-prolyl isomerase